MSARCSFLILESDFICCNLAESESGPIVLYFYAKEVSVEQYLAIERKTLDAAEFGEEVRTKLRQVKIPHKDAVTLAIKVELLEDF